MSEHTPGPWIVDTDDLGTWISSPAYPQPIAKMGKCTSLPQQANARLIAAAPELLEELEDMINQYGENVEVGWRKRLHDGARRAIAKAKGAQ